MLTRGFKTTTGLFRSIRVSSKIVGAGFKPAKPWREDTVHWGIVSALKSTRKTRPGSGFSVRGLVLAGQGKIVAVGGPP